METTFEQNPEQDYFAGVDISATVAHNELTVSQINIDARGITRQALLALQEIFPTLQYNEACAVVICDRDMQDMPVIYASTAFENLTGYAPGEVLGRNCRFLQLPNHLSPGRIVGPLPAYNGFDPNRTVLRQKIIRGQAAYVTIINYHKNGQAFLNGLAVVPVSSKQSRYYVGFQTDISPRDDLSRQPDKLGSCGVSRGSSDLFQLSIHGAPSSSDMTSERPWSVSSKSFYQTSNVASPSNTQHDLSISPVRLADFESMISMLSVIPGYILFVIGPLGRILFCSGNSESVLGFSPERLHQRSFFDIIHSQDVTAFRADLRKLVPGGACEMICRLSTAGGNAVYMDFRSSRALSTARPSSYFILSGQRVCTTFIPEVHIAPDAVDNQPILLAKISLSGLILYSTSALRSLLHALSPLQEPLAAAEVIGRSFQSHLCPRCCKVFHDAMATMGDGPIESVEFQHCFKRPDGSKLAMISNILLTEDDCISTTKTRPSTFFIRLHCSNSDGEVKRRSGRRSSKGSAKPTSRLYRGPICLAEPERQENTTPKASSLTIRRLEAQSRSRGLPGATATINRLSPTWASFQNHDKPESDIFGFDPPKAPGPAPASASLLPQDGDFCWQYAVQSLALENQGLRNEIRDIRASIRARRRWKRAKKRDQVCANCGTSDTPEWRRGPSGERDLCNKCGLRYAKTDSK